MAAKIPKLPRGRPGKGQQGLARKVARQKRRVAELFEHRRLFVRRHLSPAQKGLPGKLTRGLPQLRTLREIMDEVYRLFDRRCKTRTALHKLERLRRRVRRFRKLGKALGKLKSPTPEKALVFPDDRLLGATSNAVERSNRVSARPGRVSTASGRRGTWKSVWRWTCSESSERANASRR